MFLRFWHVILEILSLAVLPQSQVPIPLQRVDKESGCVCLSHSPRHILCSPKPLYPHRAADNLFLKGVPADVTYTGLVVGQLLHNVAAEQVVHCWGKNRMGQGYDPDQRMGISQLFFFLKCWDLNQGLMCSRATPLLSYILNPYSSLPFPASGGEYGLTEALN